MACAQRSLLPPSPHPPPNALYAGGWTPRYDAGQPPLPVPRQKKPRQARLSDKKDCAHDIKRGRHSALRVFVLYRTSVQRYAAHARYGTPYASKTGRGRQNAFLFLSSWSTGPCLLPAVQRRGPAAPPEKSFLEGGAGENLLSTKGSPPLKSPPPLSSYCGAAALLSLSPLLARRLRYSGWAVARPEKISSTEAARAWGRTSST